MRVPTLRTLPPSPRYAGERGSRERCSSHGRLGVVLLASTILLGCDRADNRSSAPTTSAGPTAAPTTSAVPAPAPAPAFEDVTAKLGLPTNFPTWPDGTYATPETTGGGVAVFDFDGDGRLDIYQVRQPPPGSPKEPAPNRLFRQEDDGTFAEVPEAAGLNDPGFGHGVAVGDYDNDGDADVYVTNFGRNVLYRNDGNGTFSNATDVAGLAQDRDYWSSSAAFFDYDRDGHLDLFVCHFADFDPEQVCNGADGKREYCGPSRFKGVPQALYHNNGDGTFTDVTAKAGISYPGRAWGVVCADLTGDGLVDIYVANDEEQQNLYVNRGDGTFADEAIDRGVAFSGLGKPEAGMGVAVADLLNDGRLALFITHFRDEKNTLYMPTEAAGYYADRSAAGGMAMTDLPYTGWGTGFFDYDLDGMLDVAVVNGAVARGRVHPKASLTPFWNAYAETNLLFRGQGAARFADAGPVAGRDFTSRPENTRGLALGDLDNDGRIDLVTNTIDNRLRVYRNVAPADGRHWLSVRALTSKRDALGATVHVTAGNVTRSRVVQSAYSYCSSNDPRAHFGLGDAAAVDRLEVTWPDGRREAFDPPPIDRVVTLRQGDGRPAADGDTAER